MNVATKSITYMDAQFSVSTKSRLAVVHKATTQKCCTAERRQAPDIVVNRRAPASCGELVQGVADGKDFLVNCPINRFVSARVTSTAHSRISVPQPESFTKVRVALSLLANFQVNGLDVEIDSDLPRGKGMGSCSAELVAVISAIGIATGKPLDSWAISHLLSHIGPFDAVHLPGVGCVSQHAGTVNALLPAPQGLSVLVVDCKDVVDPTKIDRNRANAIHREDQQTVTSALNRVRTGLLNNNLCDIAEAATVSATLNQRISFKPIFDELLATSMSLGALGVNCAHRGTVLGVLYPTDCSGIAERLRKDIDTRFGESANVLGHHQIIGGGCTYC